VQGSWARLLPNYERLLSRMRLVSVPEDDLVLISDSLTQWGSLGRRNAQVLLICHHSARMAFLRQYADPAVFNELRLVSHSILVRTEMHWSLAVRRALSHHQDAFRVILCLPTWHLFHHCRASKRSRMLQSLVSRLVRWEAGCLLVAHRCTMCLLCVVKGHTF